METSVIIYLPIFLLFNGECTDHLMKDRIRGFKPQNDKKHLESFKIVVQTMFDLYCFILSHLKAYNRSV